MPGLSAAARMLVILLAVVLVCAPLCPPHHCARTCCPAQSNRCDSSIDQTVACLSASAPAVPAVPIEFHPAVVILIPARIAVLRGARPLVSFTSLPSQHLSPPIPLPLRI